MSSDPITAFCRQFGINENVYRACAAAGTLTLRIFLSNYHPRAAEYEAPMPESEAPKAETGSASPSTGTAPIAEPAGISGWPEARIAAILTSPEGIGRPKAAEHLARRTSLSVEAARGLLGALPFEMGTFSSDATAAVVRADPAHVFPPGSALTSGLWSKVIKSVNGNPQPGATTSRELLSKRA